MNLKNYGGVYPNDTMIIDKNTKTLIAVIVVIFLIVSSATFLIVRNNNSADKNISGNFTELYIYVPNSTASSVMAILPDGTSFNHIPAESKYKIALNDSLNISFAIGNLEGHSMNYTFMVYQSNLNTNNTTSNISQIYLGATEMIENKGTLVSWVQFSPAYSNNDSRIGIALFDKQADGNMTLLNSSEITADVYNP